MDIRDTAFVGESFGHRERHVSYRVGDSWSRATTFELSSMRLSVGACRFAPGFSFDVVQPPAELEIVVSKGGMLDVRTADGHRVRRGGNSLEVGSTKTQTAMHVTPDGDTAMESLTISLGEQRMCELLGARELSPRFRSVTHSDDAYPVLSQTMTPRLGHLLDEIIHADVQGASRLLWHEAKCLELVALITDEVADEERAAARLSPHEIERVERVRKSLVEHLAEPLTLDELARIAGFSTTKLKGAFRTRFGTSLFAYLRQVRMDEARRLLAARHGNVSEVALRVGYSNPSKFAAAFRRQFGFCPSSM